jgi:2-oxoglutarate/2-oxoacid ferredoxin oxidoreductase subunit beta
MATATERSYKAKDYASDQEVRWCPGCGDYAILASMQRALAVQGLAPEKIAFVSGIGCSSRFPYYMDTYGFHTIHGRAPALATGLKIARPDMQVWVVTGDGDGLSIGGNHLIHVLRRNVNLKLLMFNNRIYGLTKGQYSPTSEVGKRTKSTPLGSIDHPFSPLVVAVGAEATFLARVVDVDAKVMADVLAAAAAHVGTAFVEILQNCNIFNDGAWESISGKEVRGDATLTLVDGEPMIFGANRDRGIRLRGFTPEVVRIGDDGVTVDDLWVHDVSDPDPTRAFILARMNSPEFPVPVGVLRAVQRPCYDALVNEQVESVAAGGKEALRRVLVGNRSWQVS